MAMNGTNMASEIVDALDGAGRLPGLNTADKNAMKADMALFCNALISHIVANMEVNGVTVDTSTLLSLPTPLVPVPTDGGAAVSAQMVTNADNRTLVQNNDGTGRVA